tara:strand:- start:9447 stop:9752 length:306 start_codon:yes stop_codon:yes gene_type:complete
MKNLNLILVVSFLMFSCGGLQEAGSVLRNEKIKTTDEFLVKKKDPLVLPPDYEKIPEPGSIQQKKINEEDKIKKILRAPKTKDISKKSSSVEQSILNEIRK